jgi:pyruvate carboxylase
MKIVQKREDFEGQLESAKREARKHFGDDEVLLERYVERSRRTSLCHLSPLSPFSNAAVDVLVIALC